MEPPNVKDGREFSRVDIRLEAVVYKDESENHVQTTHDVSMKGIFLEGDFQLSEGDSCQVILLLKGVEPPLEVHTEGTVSRVTEIGVGIAFTRLELDAYDHLKQIVLHNSHDNTDLVEKELQNHSGINKK